MSEHADFLAAFQGGRFRPVVGEPFVVVAVPLGLLKVPSGRLAACDPFTASQVEPFEREVPRGEWPVTVAVARFASGDERVAAARVRFGEAPAVRWELATLAGQDAAGLQPGEIFGYPVDAGTGCFADAAAARALEGEEEQAALLATVEGNQVDTWSHAERDGVVAFSTGWGDGYYASFWGLAADGACVELATDFGLLLEPVRTAVELDPDGPLDPPELREAGVRVRRGPSDRGGPHFEVVGGRALELEVWANGTRLPGSVSTGGDCRAYGFGPLPKGAKLRISTLRGLEPIPRD